MQVDATSGLLPTDHSPSTINEMFLEGSEPTAEDNVHQVFRINRENGKLATVYTPPELVEERVYEIYPPVAADWAKENEIPVPPDEYDETPGSPAAAGPVAIIRPLPYAYVSGGVVITGNVMSDNFALYRLEYGQGINPTEWNQLGGDHGNQVENAPLEFWDTSGLPEGLYTMQLTAVRNDQSFDRSSVQVTVDNSPPEAFLLNPPDGKVYKMEDEEWVNIQVEAVDNVSMDRVEYYLDGEQIGESTVAPFSLKWNIAMTDSLPSLETTAITETQVITNPDGTTAQQVITLTEVMTITHAEDEERIIEYVQVYSGGLSIISNTTSITRFVGYTETHTLNFKAFDAAGNETEGEDSFFSVIHDPEVLEEEGKPEGALLPNEEWYWWDERTEGWTAWKEEI